MTFKPLRSSPLERGLRIGCGALYGLIALGVVVTAILYRWYGWPLAYPLIGLALVLCSWLAIRQVEDLWGRLAAWIRRLRNRPNDGGDPKA